MSLKFKIIFFSSFLFIWKLSYLHYQTSMKKGFLCDLAAIQVEILREEIKYP